MREICTFGSERVMGSNPHVLLDLLAIWALDPKSLAKDNELFDTKFDEITEGITKAILGELNIKYIKPVKAVTESSNKTLYRVMAGSYAVRENADRQVEKLRAAGFDATVMIFNQ